MNNGRVEQIGSPLELYDNPANLFVAGFIRLAGDELPEGRLQTAQLSPSAAASAFPSRTKLESGRDVPVGVRPEHLAVAADGCAAEVLREPTGADTQDLLQLAGTAVTEWCRERHDFRPGESIRLKPPYLFVDPSSGARYPEEKT